jgi:hypothetical protein
MSSNRPFRSLSCPLPVSVACHCEVLAIVQNIIDELILAPHYRESDMTPASSSEPQHPASVPRPEDSNYPILSPDNDWERPAIPTVDSDSRWEEYREVEEEEEEEEEEYYEYEDYEEYADSGYEGSEYGDLRYQSSEYEDSGYESAEYEEDTIWSPPMITVSFYQPEHPASASTQEDPSRPILSADEQQEVVVKDKKAETGYPPMHTYPLWSFR